MAERMEKLCCVCGIPLPNRWAVARQETVDGEERYFCHLHAKRLSGDEKKDRNGDDDVKKVENQSDTEREIARTASGERARKAWNECSALAARLGGGVKALWGRIHPDHSPEAMLATLDGNLADNVSHRTATKDRLDEIYREIVQKKKLYQSAPPVRQKLLKIELQTLLTRYKGLEREFSILCENERSIETVKGRFLEILAYGRRGKVDASVVDRLTDDVDCEAEEAEDIQDALGDLERAGRRKERPGDDLDAELAGFEVDGAFTETENHEINTKEQENKDEDHDQISGVDDPDGVGA